MVVSRRIMLCGLGSTFMAALSPGITAATTLGGTINSASALAIGRAVYAADVVESKVHNLADALRLSEIDFYLCPDQLRAALSTRIQADFFVGDMVIVDGWVLSRTEARFYALIALQAEDSSVEIGA